MKIAITGGTGFVGRHLARSLVNSGHEVVLIARGVDRRDPEIRTLDGAVFAPIGINDEEALVRVFDGCDAVAHCAGINRETGEQTYQRVHVEGTQNVVNAARRAGVKRMLFLSFLRARPGCSSPYHESKWAAEEIVRGSGLDYTVIRAGVIYGKGDHMLDHLSHAFHTFGFLATVGMKQKTIRPLAVSDLIKVTQASLTQGRLTRETVAMVGPEEMSLSEAARRVAGVIGKRIVVFPLPVFLHYLIAWCFEQTMIIPLVARAQVRILSEGVAEALPVVGQLPEDLLPATRFTEDEIRRGLPPAGKFGLKDCRCMHERAGSVLGLRRLSE
ncbi:MAG TPA: NAD-dependent epimerase/dehydratase family protein [Blastocatellia bacterium]|nr:NAD-dependent epimerase/dehydratase family protein [Blastocatellia bacterium]